MVQPVRSRVRRHRDHLRAQGLRPVQIWVPDTRAAGFREEARRQSLAVNAADRRDGSLDFLESIEDDVFGEDAP
ncbi:antitoxin MazE family protein [Azospirillum isscasi]|uniref:Antitoxin MazE family protein n=1 Tax=Azospirillum isscasi TaxID=3053926 RepID=A0ABU0WI16_9PROT|nr:antitoxin MazE family protein [Azospirillum isscasi]MDQ2103742.1 antitoxin MazE family protein [Azospirillum isscasi]